MRNLFTRQTNEVVSKFLYRETPKNTYTPQENDKSANFEHKKILSSSRVELSSLVDQVLASPESSESIESAETSPKDPGEKVHKKTEAQVAEERVEGHTALINDALTAPVENFLAQTEEDANRLGGWEQFVT